MNHVIFDVGFPLTMFRLAYYLATPHHTDSQDMFPPDTLANQLLYLYSF